MEASNDKKNAGYEDRALKENMHTYTTGAGLRSTSIENHRHNGTTAHLTLQPAGLLSRENLRRLVAAMVD